MEEGVGVRRQLLPRLCNNLSMNPSGRTAWIVQQAQSIGFDLCGVTTVLSDGDAAGWPELTRLPEWLARGYAGEMRYL